VSTAKRTRVKKYEGGSKTEVKRPRSSVTRRTRRDPERSRARILAAAMKEFALRGFAGARVDAIAKRARINKRMLYHYFGNKEELFEATIMAIQAEKEQMINAGPTAVEEMLPYIYANVGGRRDWLRMMQWEALTYGSREAPAEKLRAGFFKPGIDRISRAQREEGVLAGEKAELASYPWLMPQVARMLTGHGPSDPQFRRAYMPVLRRIIGYFTRP